MKTKLFLIGMMLIYLLAARIAVMPVPTQAAAPITPFTAGGLSPASTCTTTLSVTSTFLISNASIPMPPSGQIYHAVYPGGPSGDEDDITASGVLSYEQTVSFMG